MFAIKDLLPEPGKERLKEVVLIWGCPACGLENTLVAEVHAKYVEAFSYPLIPLGKELSVHCSSCGYQSALETLPDDLKAVCTRILKSSKTPIHHYKAFTYIIVIVCFFLIFQYMKEPGFVKYLEDPKTGDLYKTSAGLSIKSYALVSAVDEYYVYLTFHIVRPDTILKELQTKKVIEIASNFIPYSKEQIYQLYKDGVIIDVERSNLPPGVQMYPKKTTNKNVEAVPPKRTSASEGVNKVNKAAPAPR